MHRVTIGRTREVRGPDALEQGVVGVIVAVAMVIAVGFGIRLICMTQTLDAVSMTSGSQVDAVVYHAVHGRWPSPGDPTIAAAGSYGTYVKHLSLGEGGVVTAELTLGPMQGLFSSRGARGQRVAHGFLSFRPELLGSRDAPTIAFLCGYAKPLVGAVTTGATNRTTLPRNVLPPFCR